VNLWQFVRRSLVHHRWMNLSVMLGVATTRAVITGALLVGESVRGSLTELTLDRLGDIDLLLVADRFFDPGLVEQTRTFDAGPDLAVSKAEGLCLIPNVTIEGRDAGRVRGVLLTGRAAATSSELGLVAELSEDQIVINQALADDLGASVGDELIVRLPVASDVPAESPLGRKDGLVQSRTGLSIARILPMTGWGQFQLTPSQQLPRTAFVLDTVLQRAVRVDGRINAVAVKASSQDRSTDEQLARLLEDHLAPSATDAGFNVELVQGQFASDGSQQIAWQYIQVTTDRMIFSDQASQVASRGLSDFGQPQPIFTYLANTISKTTNDEPSIPYSTITAIDPHPTLGPDVDRDGAAVSIGPGEIYLNEWAAADLLAEVGDQIEVRYFAAETTHGQAVELAAEFQLAGILPLRHPTQPYRRNRPAEFDDAPDWANDPNLTPTVAGVTDQQSIDDWDPPFPFDSNRVRDVDDQYWDEYRTTPKAFVSLADGQRLWGSRFGRLTALRIPVSDGLTVAAVEAKLAEQVHLDPAAFGFEFRPVKLAGINASRGTTPFEWLFLGFSMFLLFSAVMLTAILFQLATLLRQKQLGTTLALGWSVGRAQRALHAESALVAAAGSLLGVLGGIAYAAIMLAGLRTWWLAAVVTPFMRLHVSQLAMGIGCCVGFVVSMLVVWRTSLGLIRTPALQLMRGNAQSDMAAPATQRSWGILVATGLAVVLGVAGTQLAGESQAGCFFGGGAALLTALLLLVRRRLRSRPSSARGRASLVELAQSSVKRNPRRSLLTVALMAAATFLVIAISAFRLSPSAAGTGGFDWIADSDRPIFSDMNDPLQRRAEFGERMSELDGTVVLSLRVQAGDDASCRNLYQPTAPRLLGVTAEFTNYFDASTESFAWAKSAGATNPWSLLQVDTEDDVIPVILDKNTAMFSLHLAGRIGEEFTVEYDRPTTFRIVGLLSNTILQGSLLVDEDHLLQAFPEVEGYRMFLVNAPPGEEESVAELLESRFNDEGFAARDAEQELSELLAVQNTYLSTFQSLGVMGLLLGAIGLAIVQCRNMVERRGELAAMQAIGFSLQRLGRLIAIENVILLALGLIVGTLAALATVMPHMIFGDASVPVRSVAAMLCLVLGMGLASSWIAARLVGRLPLLESLRRDA
jgi:ABC-type antimicrobial peptide transport system permease subunit